MKAQELGQTDDGPADFSRFIREHLTHYKLEVLKVRACGVWKKRPRTFPHILPEDQMKRNILEPIYEAFWRYLPTSGIKLHTDFPHLNSSQALCFNLFFPFMTNPDSHPVWLQQLGFAGNEGIKEFVLERVFKDQPWHNGMAEGAKFDSYMKLGSAVEVFVGLKYSESKFGSAEPDSMHQEKYRQIYEPRLRTIISAEFRGEDKFYPNYQFFRMVSYLSPNDNSQLVLILPRANGKLAGTETLVNDLVLPDIRPRIKVLYLEDLVAGIQKSSVGLSETFREHYRLFKEKYLPPCPTP